MTAGGALDTFVQRWRASTPEDAMELAAARAVEDFAKFPPIDPVAVASQFGATVTTLPGTRDRKADLLDHGQLQVKEGRWHIRIPLQLSAERRRFSISHEIGHILLFSAVANRAELVRELRSQALYSQVERLCNLGAARILMPTDEFERKLAVFSMPTLPAIESMASVFFVSLEAAARRVTEIRGEWSVMFWELATDHPRGAAWRTAQGQQRDGGVFLPSGMSSSRLKPDIVAAAALEGSASEDVVYADLPGIIAMKDAWAWRVPRSRRELVKVEGASAVKQRERIFLFYRKSSGI